ncbi:ABC transporter substrate-binding protein [Halopseudomonas pachastrellae]|nr:ABC transporter substrate-binding protein [Halopseudomonas pachastrellae]
MTNGEVIKRAVPHEIPSPTQAMFFNTRRTPFDSLALRKALGMLFDFEWSNRVLFYDAYQRSTSYYPNSPFSATGIRRARSFFTSRLFAISCRRNSFLSHSVYL